LLILLKYNSYLALIFCFNLNFDSELNSLILNCSVIPTYFNKVKLNPYWVTGFSDGDSSFTTVLSKNFTRLSFSYEISLHIKDIAILERIRDFFNCGNISTRPDINRATYRVTDIKDIKNIIIPHFFKYNLLTLKSLDFKLWSELVLKTNKFSNLNSQDLESILPYLASINNGLTKDQSIKFTEIIPVNKGILITPNTINPFWLSGFTAAEGNFYLFIRNTGQLTNIFSITQHDRDLNLLNLFSNVFNCGKLYHRSKDSRCDFSVQNRVKIKQEIIPFFKEYPLVNIKTLDFEDFSKGISLHNTQGWKESVNNIIQNMNTKRKFK
jgi:hypothetical protein